MANHYRVSPKFHLWARRRGLSDAETRLAFYLLTTEHRNLEGLYRLPKPYIAADLGWPLGKVEENLAAVLATGFAMYDEYAEMVLIPKALKHQSPSTALQIKGAIAQLERIPRTSLWDAFVAACATHCSKLADEIAKEWPSHRHRMNPPPAAESGEGASRDDANGIALPSHDDAIYAHARGGSSSSSSSNSNPPLAPPASAGGEPDHPGDASPVRANSRALGTSGRHLDRAVLAAQDAAAAAAAVLSLAPAEEQDLEGWERYRAALEQSSPEGTYAQWLRPLRLAAVDQGVLVIDHPDSLGWVRGRFGRVLDRVAERADVGVRLATDAEHEGFASGAVTP